MDSVADLRDARVAVMSTPACPYCKRAKEALAGAGVAFVDVDVGSDEALRQMVRELTGKRTVPQIFVGGRSVGGCDDLLAQMADGSFAAKLSEAEAGAAGGDGGSSGRGADARPAVPAELLAEIAAARRRAEAGRQQAGASTSSSSSSWPPRPRPRLAQTATRLGRGVEQGGIARSDVKIGSRTFRAFSLRALLEWLAAAGDANPPAMAQQLLGANLITPAAVDLAAAERAAAAVAAAGAAGSAGAVATGSGDEVQLTLVAEAPPPAAGEPLNTTFWWQGPARPANEVASSLRALILQLYDDHLSPDGRALSYGALRADPRFATFVAATAELQKVDLAPLSRPELTALAINLYNALIVHAMAALGLTRMSAAQRATFFSRTALYCIGGLPYTADDLEHGVLRGNRAGAANVFNLLGLHGLAGGHWREGDPRLAKVVSPVDPRIHFALVCGARSCPPIKTFSAANLEEGLAAAAEAFCGGEVELEAARREVRLSKIFKWYAIDFGANKYERLSYIAGLLSEPARGELLGMLREAQSGGRGIKVSYKEYDWGLNGTD